MDTIDRILPPLTAILLVISAGLLYNQYEASQRVAGNITSYEECVKAGYPTTGTPLGICSHQEKTYYERHDLLDLFESRLLEGVVEKIGPPIEGLTPGILLNVYPGLENRDFKGVDALQGRYELQNGEAVFTLDTEEPLHSAADTISERGMQELLNNLAERLEIEIKDQDSIEKIMSRLEGSKDPGEGGLVETAVYVEEVSVSILESFPVQVRANIRGNLPDPCTNLGEIKAVKEGNVFNLSLKGERPADVSCAQVLTPFEKSVALDVYGLEKGTYTVDVEGVRTSFELQVDNIIK